MELLMNLESGSGRAPYLRISKALRDAVGQGRLKPGQRLPSVRELSRTLLVARATVLKAYADLEQHGMLKSVPGSGTFINPDFDEPGNSERSGQSRTACAEKVFISAFASQLMFGNELPIKEPIAHDQQIKKVWKRLMLKHCRAILPKLFARTANGVQRCLKSAVRNFLVRNRAVDCRVEQIFIAPSKSLLFDLVLRLRVTEADCVVVGEGTPVEICRILSAHGADVRFVAVDSDGLVIEELMSMSTPPKLIYVMPSHHQPVGVVLSCQRRRQLVSYARSVGALIIEDDYESEFQIGRQMRPSMQGVAGNEVIYFSSLPDRITPLLSVGAMVVPPFLAPSLAAASLEDDLPLIEQLALSELIACGELELNIKVTHKMLSARKRALIYSLTRYMRNLAELSTQTASNVQTIAVLIDATEEEIVGQARSCGLRLSSTREFYQSSSRRKEFFLLLDQLEEQEIESKIKAWADLIGTSIPLMEKNNEHHI